MSEQRDEILEELLDDMRGRAVERRELEDERLMRREVLRTQTEHSRLAIEHLKKDRDDRADRVGSSHRATIALEKIADVLEAISRNGLPKWSGEKVKS